MLTDYLWKGPWLCQKEQVKQRINQYTLTNAVKLSPGSKTSTRDRKQFRQVSLHELMQNILYNNHIVPE